MRNFQIQVLRFEPPVSIVFAEYFADAAFAVHEVSRGIVLYLRHVSTCSISVPDVAKV